MIDKLVFRCNFSRDSGGLFPDFELSSLSVPVEQSIDAEGYIHNTRHPWESIPSSYESMAFKIFDYRYNQLDQFYIEIKASPAKIMHGHNIYGSSDFYDCSFHLLSLLFEAYPQIYPFLDVQSFELIQIDITYSSRAKDDNEARAFINSLCNVSFGQTKCRTGFDGTAYFGKKNSRLKKIKVYSKSHEVLETLRKNANKVDGDLLNEVYTPELLDFASGLIRWEVSLYHRHFERIGVPTLLQQIFRHNLFSPQNLQNFWYMATNDLFNSLKGQTMKIINDTDIKNALRAAYQKTSKKTGNVSFASADSAFRTYRDIRRDGWLITRESMVVRTFDRHVKMLCSCGLSRAALQNMSGLNDGAQIIPFVRFIQVDFNCQYPDGYIQPAPKYVNESNKLQLRLVA